jgi:hypothetical protein
MEGVLDQERCADQVGDEEADMPSADSSMEDSVPGWL